MFSGWEYIRVPQAYLSEDKEKLNTQFFLPNSPTIQITSPENKGKRLETDTVDGGHFQQEETGGLGSNCFSSKRFEYNLTANASFPRTVIGVSFAYG